MAHDININPDLILGFSLSILEERYKVHELRSMLYNELCKVVEEEDIVGVTVRGNPPRDVEIQCENTQALDFLSINGFSIGTKHIALEQPGYGPIKVSIQNAPLNMPNAIIADYLERYGTIKTLSNDYYFHTTADNKKKRTDWRTGNRTAFIKLHDPLTPIPPSVHLRHNNKSELIFVYHDGQTEMRCRFCKKHAPRYGHECEMAPQRKCFNCGATDHFKANCTVGLLCNKCHQPGHMARNCPRVFDQNFPQLNSTPIAETDQAEKQDEWAEPRPTSGWERRKRAQTQARQAEIQTDPSPNIEGGSQMIQANGDESKSKEEVSNKPGNEASTPNSSNEGSAQMQPKEVESKQLKPEEGASKPDDEAPGIKAGTDEPHTHEKMMKQTKGKKDSKWKWRNLFTKNSKDVSEKEDSDMEIEQSHEATEEDTTWDPSHGNLDFEEQTVNLAFESLGAEQQHADVYMVGGSNCVNLTLEGDKQLKVKLKNLSYSGLRIKGTHLQLDNIHRKERENIEYLVLNVGINNIDPNGHNDTDQFLYDYQNMLGKVSDLAPKAQIIVSAILPFSRDNEKANDDIAVINQHLYEMCQNERGFKFCDHGHFVRDEDFKVKKNLFRDERHLYPSNLHLLSNSLLTAIKYTYLKNNISSVLKELTPEDKSGEESA